MVRKAQTAVAALGRSLFVIAFLGWGAKVVLAAFLTGDFVAMALGAALIVLALGEAFDW